MRKKELRRTIAWYEGRVDRLMLKAPVETHDEPEAYRNGYESSPGQIIESIEKGGKVVMPSVPPMGSIRLEPMEDEDDETYFVPKGGPLA